MQRRTRNLLALGAIAGVVALFAGGCTQLPSNDARDESRALTDTQDTTLGRAAAPRTARHPGLTGLHLLPDSHDAFAARMLLAQLAERSLDLQYYIWHGDMTGTLLFEALHAAAERGVRVRLLIDDNNTVGLDATLSVLDAHPNIEVRLFNPFANRGVRALGYLTDFSRLNRRMHNKSFTADSQATIIGGRNVGDEYFGAKNGPLFADLDAFAIGPVVAAVSADFDRYWNSASAYPVRRLVPPADAAQLADIAANAARVEQDPAARRYLAALRRSSFIESIVEQRLPFIWASTRMVADDPAKVLGRVRKKDLLLPKLQRTLGTAERRIDLVSPYFVPTAAGMDALARLSAAGVHIRVLTNSLEATDVAVVHAGYAKYRKPLLEAGIELFELRRIAGDVPQPRSHRGSAGLGSSGSSASSLHAKTFSVDNARAFIGSFNFDPRSARLNTELGFLIESGQIAASISDAFDGEVLSSAYEVRLDQNGHLYWIERNGDGSAPIRHDTEPGTGVLQRAVIDFLSLLPIEWML